VGARNIFHNVLGLALSLIGVAGLFLYLNSPYVALMQILIYVGAITIAICFAVMLSEPLYRPGPPQSFLKTLGALLGAGAVMAFLVAPDPQDPMGGRGRAQQGLVRHHHRPLFVNRIRPHF
jgi:NADH:ubiquinone oxidoreductase subunit 6 (subunit J)